MASRTEWCPASVKPITNDWFIVHTSNIITLRRDSIESPLADIACCISLFSDSGREFQTTQHTKDVPEIVLNIFKLYCIKQMMDRP